MNESGTGAVIHIQINKVSKTYHLAGSGVTKTLGFIDFTIDVGEFVILLGESGCGKTTLLKIIAGMEKPTTGEVVIDDKQVKDPDPSRIMLFQEPTLLPWLNVTENIMFGCRIRGEKEDLAERVDHYIRRMNLAGYENHMPAELSAGMQQRVCLARSLIAKPDILLLDEPFGALDPFTRSKLQEELLQLWKSRRFTALFVTHDIEEALLLGSKIKLMGGSPAAVLDTIDNPMEHPRHMDDPLFSDMKALILEKFRLSLNESENAYFHNSRLI